MASRTIVVVGVVTCALTACSDGPPSAAIEASWTLARGDRPQTCAEAQFDGVRLTAVPIAGGAAVTRDVPCADGTAELEVEAGEHTLTGDLLVGGQETAGELFDHVEQIVVVPATATSVATLAFQTSTPTGRLHIRWSGFCSFDTVRLDITGGESFSAPCMAGELTTGDIPLGPDTCRWNAVDGFVEVFWADLSFDLTARGQLLELERVDF
jgi:hypothetical protein